MMPNSRAVMLKFGPRQAEMHVPMPAVNGKQFRMRHMRAMSFFSTTTEFAQAALASSAFAADIIFFY